MLSAIIPTYRNPTYLDLCLRSATENRQEEETEIIVVIDGYPKESMDIVEKYDDINVLPLERNMGMQYALNLGVMNATNPFVFICNDDNVFPAKWDHGIREAIEYHKDPDKFVITFNQVEPTPGIYNFVVNDLGRDAESFRYDEWLEFEESISTANVRSISINTWTPNGRIFPFTISKRWYMAVGGFDTLYQSPFWCDVDLWLKLELTNQLKFQRYHGCHFYHFGSIATKNRGDAEAEIFKRSEGGAAETFRYKWGFLPDIVAATQHGNTRFPLEAKLQGIDFEALRQPVGHLGSETDR